jgi:pimeloyl-ACP methyl ester carboxylesterase
MDWKPHVVRAIQRESAEVPLWDDLTKVQCPVMVIGGEQPEALLKPEHIERYHQYLPPAEIIIFKDSGHNVSQPDYQRFIRTLSAFLEKID